MDFPTMTQNFMAIVLLALTMIIAGIIGWNIFLQLKIRDLKRKSDEFFAGGKVHNLEELLLTQAKSLRSLDKDIQELFNISNQIHNLAFKGIFKVGLVRYNPFKDVGGDQSFALALLNGKNSGVTISSLYTREGTRVYSKSITNSESLTHPLTGEEKEAIQKALSLTSIKDIEKPVEKE